MKSAILVCVFLVLLAFNLSAITAPKQQPLEEQSIDSILSWMHAHAFKVDTDSLAPYGHLALQKARSTQDPVIIGDAYSSLTMFYVQMTTYDSIEHYAQKALSYHQMTGDQMKIADCYIDLGYAAFNKLSFLTAEEHFLKAISILENRAASNQLSDAYRLLAGSYELSDANEEAIKYGELAYSTAQSISDTTNVIWALIYLTPTYIKLGQNEMALERVTESLQWIGILGNPNKSQSMDAHYYRGDAFIAMGQLDSAWIEYSLALKLAKEKWMHTKPEAALFFTDGLAYIHQLRGEYQTAINMYQKLLEHLYYVGEYENLVEIHERLAQCYEGENDLPQALTQSRMAWHLEDSIKTLRHTALASELQIRYETTKREKTIETQKDQIDRQESIQLLIIGIAILSLLLLSIIYYVYRSNKRKNQQLQLLNQSLLEKNTLLDERNAQNETLLKEIHHRVKNNLEVVSSLLELQSARLNDVHKMAFQSCQGRIQSMSLIHEKLYHKKDLSTIEMRDYFRNLGEFILDSYVSNGLIVLDYKMRPLEVDLDTAVPIGLIVNELLTNALKYAFPNGRTGRIEISLNEVDNDFLKLEVADNGIGKSSSDNTTQEGFGLELIKLLTRQLGGTLKEEISNGTKMTLLLKRANVI